MSEAEAALALKFWQENHCQGPTVPSRDAQPHRYELAEHIASLAPRHVLELGCASGRNLAILHDALPTADLCGIDPNPTTLNAARRAHGSWLELHEGTHALLDQFVDNSFDVVFTVSVLDHVPVPEWYAVYDEMVRVARKAVVLLEPILRDSLFGDNGWTESTCADAGIESTPFTYLHAYRLNDTLLRIIRPLPIDTIPWKYFGSLYHLMQRDK
jgi:ubiquinone/menaquinone biosynthesis C-methylase UbiE